MTDPIKAKIQELVPEMMELKFGCEVKLAWLSSSIMQKELHKKFGTDTFVYDGQAKLLCDHGWLDFNDMYLMQDKGFWEILGSPITLAVVLRAIEKAQHAGCELTVYGDELLIGHYEKSEREGYYSHAYWNLTKDNYDDQSEETKAFIGKLLGV